MGIKSFHLSKAITELDRLKASAKKGKGPVTLKEERHINKKTKAEKQKASQGFKTAKTKPSLGIPH